MPKRTHTNLSPVLRLVHEQSTPGLDACQAEILRQAQDAHPSLPVALVERTWADFGGRAS